MNAKKKKKINSQYLDIVEVSIASIGSGIGRGWDWRSLQHMATVDEKETELGRTSESC